MTDTARSLPQQNSTDDLSGPMNAYAIRLHAAVEDLQKQRSVSVSRFENLAREILLDIHETPQGTIFLPESQCSSCEQPIWSGTPTESCVYTTGIQTARLIAWAVSHRQAWLDRRELLTIAALLQDVGLLLLKSAHAMTPRALVMHHPEQFRKHPELGAALVGNITDCSVDLPRLIAQHHERLDGTGYPRQLRSRRLPETSRFLAIAVRFMELRPDGSQQDRESSRRPQHLFTATQAALPYQPTAEALLREAARGDWDLTLTVGFLESLGFRVSNDRLFSEQEPRMMALSRFGRKMFRIEAGHTVVSPPHFGSIRQTAAEPSHTELSHTELSHTEPSHREQQSIPS